MSKLQNFSSLAVNELRRVGLHLVEAGLLSIDTKSVVRRLVSREGSLVRVAGDTFDSTRGGRLLVVGVGKCSFEAAEALEELLGDALSGGIVLDIQGGQTLKRIKSCVGDHPYSSERNCEATAEIIQLLKGCTERDFIIFVISGGGSALLCQPEHHTCEDEKKIIKALFQAGADIYKTNLVRKHLSLARGGYLASYAYPASSVALIFSDVPGDRLEWVSSGPTYPDLTTVEDAKKIIEEYKIEDAVGFKIPLIETPKDTKFFEATQNVLACSARTALDAMKEAAEKLGYRADIVEEPVQGEASEVGKKMMETALALPAKTAVFSSGETTVTFTGAAERGGRNLEMAIGGLRAAASGALFIPVASDGHDNTEYAGALCDIITAEKVREAGLSVEQALATHGSYEFFKKIDQYLMTGDTGSNVSDLFIAIHE